MKAVSPGPINQAVAGCHQLCSGGRLTDLGFLGCWDFRMHEGSENLEGRQGQWSFFNFQGPGTLKLILTYNHFPVHSPGRFYGSVPGLALRRPKDTFGYRVGLLFCCGCCQLRSLPPSTSKPLCTDWVPLDPGPISSVAKLGRLSNYTLISGKGGGCWTLQSALLASLLS